MTTINATEIRRALRALRARPWFTVGATVSLAFGIGANTTVFTIVNGLVFRPLPYPGAERLVFVRAANQRVGVENGGVSLDELDVIRRNVRSLSGIGAVRESDFNLSVGDRSQRVRGAVVSAVTLRTLGVAPMRGSMLVAADDAPAAPARAIVSERLWRTTLGGSLGSSGGAVRVDGVPFEVIGVMPSGFGFPDQSDLWIPIGAAGATASGPPSSSARAFLLLARLAMGAEPSSARAELRTLGTAMDALRPAPDRGWSLTVTAADAERGENARPAVYLLFALVTSVLLVACANFATLLAARAVAGQRELAIRSALGANRAQLVWHGLVESVVVTVAGVILSILVVAFGSRAVRLSFPVGTLPFWLRFDIDWRVMAYASALAIATVLAFGLGPAVWSARRAPASGLLQGSRSATSNIARGRLSGVLIAGQLAVSMVLVVTASLLAVAVHSMATSPLGYEPDGLVTADIEPRGRRYMADDASRAALYATLASNLRAIPGVEGVSGFDVWGAAPLELASRAASPQRVDGPVYSVLPSYFETLRVRLIAGRSPASDARDDATAAVVNETFARRHWPNESALGRQVRIVRPNSGGQWLTVVGVVDDVRRNPADPEREPHLYVSALHYPPRRLRLVARAAPAAISAAALEHAARNADRDEPIGPPVTMRRQIAEWTAPTRFFGGSLAGFAVVAVMIAITGVVGVVSAAVTARTREFGIRLALGASPAGMVRLAIDRAARVALIGAGTGLIVSLGVARALVTLPFGVERVDGGVVSVAAAVFVFIALAAAWMPARRAGRVEPTIALSHDA